MNIETQIEELKVYFDTEDIINKSKVEKLTMTEYQNIKIKIKNEKKDKAYPISDRVYIQMMNSQVFIFDYSTWKKQ